MRFLVLLAEADASAWERATDAERAEVYEQHYAFDAAVRARGTIVSGEALAAVETAHTLRTVDGVRTVTEGPYAEAVEQLGGFYLIDVADLATALELVAVLPAAYTIEVRAAIDMPDYQP